MQPAEKLLHPKKQDAFSIYDEDGLLSAQQWFGAGVGMVMSAPFLSSTKVEATPNGFASYFVEPAQVVCENTPITTFSQLLLAGPTSPWLVVSEDGQLKGHIDMRSMAKAIAMLERRSDEHVTVGTIMEQRLRIVAATEPVEDLIGLLAAPDPIVVVESNGRPLGTISREKLVYHLIQRNLEVDGLRSNIRCISTICRWLSSILYSINEGILVADANTVVRFINPAYTRITGVTEKDIIGKPVGEVRPGAMLPTVIKTGQPMSGVKRQVGEVEYVVDMSPIIIDGKVVGGVTIAREMSEVQNLLTRLTKVSAKASSLENKISEAYKAKYNFSDIIGESHAIREAIAAALKEARSDMTVLITGETGVGKELFAHAIHNASLRSERPFVPINCAAIPANLLESELFGYASGAFTGAARSGKSGLFEIADGGTVFLDEIGDMGLELQGKVLRVIESQEFQPIGGHKPISVNVRVIAATNKDLEGMVRKGLFREDLYYRLSGFPIRVPPLRKRKDDIPILVNSFLSRFNSQHRKNIVFRPEALKLMKEQEWPGNVRELKNFVFWVCTMVDKPEVTADYLLAIGRRHEASCRPSISATEVIPLKKIEREAILHALEVCGKTTQGKKQAAKLLGISRATLYNKLKEYKLDHPSNDTSKA